MQKLHPWNVQRRRDYDVVPGMPALCLLSFCWMPEMGTRRGVLVAQSAGQKCGAVVPHCDFQKHLPQIALKQRGLALARTRIGRAPPRPHLCALKRYPERASGCNTPRDSGKRSDPKQLALHFPKF